MKEFAIGDVLKYMEYLQEIKNRQRRVLEVHIDDVHDHRNDDDFVTNVTRNTVRYLRYFEDAVDELLDGLAETVVRQENDVFDILQHQREAAVRGNGDPLVPAPKIDVPRGLTRRYEVFIVPASGEKARKIREIKASDIGRLVKIRGMVTRVSDVKPHMSVCTYTCDVCGSEIYHEVVGVSFMPITKCVSQRCIDNKTVGNIHQQSRGCRFVKYQELRMQELPDQVPQGHIPRSITVHCRGERTRLCGPGDIVTLSGVFSTTKFTGYRAIAAGLQAQTHVDAMVIEKQKLGYKDMENSNGDDDAIRELVRDPDLYERLAQSIAPEIFGHDDVKKALLLQLISGATRSLPDGMKIRGDINICLMGDPGVAKSQLLKYIATVSPRGVYTTGKGSSGVGLTAAVVRDTMTGDMTLEGGALVLADMGICCVDEFDKMDESDRTAIHEVMEQQTISIAKAGITTTLNARAAVLAAANPLYGRYNRRKSISENVDLPNSLLSRFDLLFLILDKAEMETDLALSKHVLHVHKFLRNPETAFTAIPPTTMKQFISLARTFTPVVPEDLTSYIVEAYVSLRSQDSGGRGPHGGPASRHNDQAVMTARQLLSILRLSQALARLRMDNTINHRDVDEAIRLTHASKASLRDDGAGAAGINQEDTMSQIYSVIRDHAMQHGRTADGQMRIHYAQAEAMVLKKGFPAQAMQDTLREYTSLGVLFLSDDGLHIIFDDAA